jgi:hypothetical protein
LKQQNILIPQIVQEVLGGIQQATKAKARKKKVPPLNPPTSPINNAKTKEIIHQHITRPTKQKHQLQNPPRTGTILQHLREKEKPNRNLSY